MLLALGCSHDVLLGQRGLDLGDPLVPDEPTGADVLVRVRSDLLERPISPRIYGVYVTDPNAPPSGRAGALHIANSRFSTYNWENNASNAGTDWDYQNDGWLSDSKEPGAATRVLLASAERLGGATTVVTIPIGDHVAADRLPGGDVRDSGADYLATRFLPNIAASGPPEPSAVLDDGQVVQADFVAWLRQAAAGEVAIALDRQPELWSTRHPEVHPVAVTYDELVERDIEFARAAKAAWPEVAVLGPASFGYEGWEYLGDRSTPDATSKGRFLEYWLSALRAAEQTDGHRLIDGLDLFYLSEATGGGERVTEGSLAAAVIEARLQAPRSLWDPSFVEESWLTADVGGPLRLIPSLLERVAATYPGTGLAFGEYSFGAEDHYSGGLAHADAMGIFGREGIELACAPEGAFTEAARRLFLDFDGAGSRFGDTAIAAESSDIGALTAYASVDAAAPSRLVVLLINKRSAPLVVGLALGHPARFTTLRAFRLGSDSPELVEAPAVLAGGLNAFSLELPATSATVLEGLSADP